MSRTYDISTIRNVIRILSCGHIAYVSYVICTTITINVFT